MSRKVLLFDIDGTLIDAGQAAHRAFSTAFLGLFGVDCSEVVVETAGRSDVAIHQEVAQALFSRTLTDEECLHLRLLYLTHLENELKSEDQYRVLPGTVALCEALSQRDDLLLGLQTGNLQGAAKLKLQIGGLLQYFQFGGYGCDSMLRAGVVAEAIARAAKLLGRQPETATVFVVGDTPYDVAAGKANNCRTVAVATGRFSLEELRECAPDVLLINLSEAEEFLQQLE